MTTPKRFFVWTTLLLETDQEQYKRARELTDEEVCQMVVDAALNGTLKRFGTQQAIGKTEGITNATTT